MSEDRIVYEKRAPRATIWLDRPEARNSMTEGMSGGFREAIIEAARDPEVRVIVYRGKGEDFCAGSALDDLPLVLAAQLLIGRCRIAGVDGQRRAGGHLAGGATVAARAGASSAPAHQPIRASAGISRASRAHPA